MARLTDFAPHWVNLPQAAPGVRFIIGVSFLNPMGENGPCPACGHNRDRRLAVNFWPPYPHANFHNRVSGDTFDTLTIAPSIGLDPLWHGTITNGEIAPAKQR